MTIATKNAATDASLARAVRQILGDDTEQWLAEQGMERLSSALRTGHNTAPEPRGSSFLVRLEAWRTLERTCLAWPNGNVHTWLSGLVENAEAFSDLFENLGNVQTETEQLALTRTRVTSVTMPEGRTLRWCERHRTSTDIETAHTSAGQQEAGSLPRDTRATGSQALVRIGQAVLVTRTVTVTDKRRPPVEDIAAMAHGAASIISPTRWEPAAPSATPVRYATWVEVDNKRHQAPRHTRLFRQYMVRAARLVEESLSVVVEGTNQHHEAMLEDALSAAAECEDWKTTPGYLTDFVDHYAIVGKPASAGWVDVPERLTMLARI